MDFAQATLIGYNCAVIINTRNWQFPNTRCSTSQRLAMQMIRPDFRSLPLTFILIRNHPVQKYDMSLKIFNRQKNYGISWSINRDNSIFSTLFEQNNQS